MASSMVTRSLAVCSTAESRARAREEKRSVLTAIGISNKLLIPFIANLYIFNIPWFCPVPSSIRYITNAVFHCFMAFSRT